jgi:PBP1b-binding outer membrane lipoprotein LpoB
MRLSKLAITIILALFLFIGCKEKPKAVESKDKDEDRPNSKVVEAVDLVQRKQTMRLQINVCAAVIRKCAGRVGVAESSDTLH